MEEKSHKIIYRNITPRDLDALIKFCDRWIGKGYFSKEQLRAALLKGIKDDFNANFLATVQDKIIAIQICHAPGEWFSAREIDSLSPGSWDVDLEDVAYLKSLFVHAKFQKKGIGSKLSRLALEQLKLMGSKAIVLHGRTDNSSIQYFSHFGFKPVAEHKNYWFGIDYDCTRCGADQRCTCTAIEMVYKL